MKRSLIAAGLCLCISCSAHAGQKTISGGVDVDSVDWAKLCPSIQPLSVTRDGVTCPVAHPASNVWRRPVNYFGAAEKMTTDSCALLVEEFDSYTKPQGEDPKTKWAKCKWAWDAALTVRASNVKYDDMTLDAFREKYFHDHIVNVKPKGGK